MNESPHSFVPLSSVCNAHQLIDSNRRSNGLLMDDGLASDNNKTTFICHPVGARKQLPMSRASTTVDGPERDVPRSRIGSTVGYVAPNKAGNRSSLTKDLLSYFEQQSAKDVELSCQGTVFYSNRILLSARSSVFNCMLGPSSSFLEGHSSKIEIHDAEPYIVEAFIEVVHTDR